MSTILKIENISKQYRLGLVGTGTIKDDLNRWWYRVRGKEDPFLMVGAVNERTAQATEDYVWALRDINFEVQEGEVLGIIGKNGAGKSTLLKILSRVTSPTTGVIKSRGRIASLLEVGTGFHPELTGRENIYLNGAILGMTKAEIASKIDEIIDFSGCEMYINTPVKRYSSGMTVRLAFAVAAHLEPDILVIDEVLAVGDAEFQKKAIGKMQEISSGEGRTVLFVSHNMASIQNLCTRVILLTNGNIRYEGETSNVISKYLEENTTLTNVDIQNRHDRQGNGKAKLIGYSILDGNSNKKIDTVVSGHPVKMTFKFENKTNKEIVDFELGVGFYNKNEVLLFACKNSVIGIKSVISEKFCEISLIIKKWPTSGGLYSFNVFTSSKGEIVDWIQNVGKINVETGDFYGNGIIPAQSAQSVFVDFNFE